MSSAATTEGAVSRRARLIGKGWIQGVALVMLFGFTVMGLLAYRTYTNSMPQPQKVVTESGETVFTTTYAEHEKAVAQWQEWCSANDSDDC